MIWATVSSRSCFCWLYRDSLSLAAKNIIILISVLTIWWCPRVELSLVLLEKKVCYDQLVLLSLLGKLLKYEGRENMKGKNYMKCWGLAMWSRPSAFQMGTVRQVWICITWQRMATASLVKPCSGQSLPPGWEAQAGREALGNQLFKKRRKGEKKEKKNSEKQQGAVPAWASLTAFLPGPSPRAATMAKYWMTRLVLTVLPAPDSPLGQHKHESPMSIWLL